MPIHYEYIIDALRELADESEQRRLWLAAADEVSSLAECKCRLFDDSGLGDALHRGEVAYSPSIDQDLRNLDTALRRVNDGRSPGEIIRDPAMVPIRAMAAATLQAMRQTAADRRALRPRSSGRVVPGR